MEKFMELLQAYSIQGQKEIISKCLSNSFVACEKQLYNFEPETRIWIPIDTSINKVLDVFLVSCLDHLRKGTLTSEDFAMLENDYDSTITRIRNGKFNKGVDQYLTSLGVGRKMDDIRNKIHFMNGSFDLDMNLFIPVGEVGGREKDELITKCISYDLEAADESLVAQFDQIMQQSFPEPYVWDYVKFLVGKSLSAESVQDCEFVLFFGNGKNGKSILLDILRTVLEEGVYVQTYNHTVFDTDAEFARSFRFVSPSVRFYLVEELSTKKKALSNLKMMCDGKLFTRELRGYANVEIPINGKLLATSNKFIRFTDGGVNRRILYYANKVKFVSEDTELEAGQCHGSPLLKREAIALMSSSMKSSIFLAFASMAVLYLRGERGDALAIRPERPFQVVRGDELPTWSTFVETYLVGCSYGKIGKTNMMAVAKNYFSFEVVLMKDMIDALAEKGIVFDKNLTELNIKGVFVGCTWKV